MTTKLGVISTVLLTCIIHALVFGVLLSLYPADSTCSVLLLVAASCAQCVIGVASYLTFTFAHSDYLLLCAKCDSACQRLAACCVTEKYKSDLKTSEKSVSANRSI